VYAAPLTAYVADFLGVANLLDVECLGSRSDGLQAVRLGDAHLVATPTNSDAGSSGHVVIRPERVRLSAGNGQGPNSVLGTVDNLVYVGATTHVGYDWRRGRRCRPWSSTTGTATS
jgi:ABC-type Fe3+/spermidine/putrescine transport system ATPase subunit